MNFNLTKYINERYLNESLQSSLFYDIIKNDKGGMFYIYKFTDNKENNRFVKIQDIYNLLERILHIFSSYTRQSNPFTETSKVKLTNLRLFNDIYIDSIEKLKQLHKKYIELFNYIIDNLSTIFNKPVPTLLNKFISNNNMDFYNITDDQIQIYKLKDIKGNKQLKSDIEFNIKSDYNIVIYRTADNIIQAISKAGIIDLISPIIDGYELDNLREYFTKENLLKLVRNYPIYIDNGEQLQFPIFDGYSRNPIYTIESRFIKKRSYSSTKVGAFYSKASNLQKITNWGKNLDDEIIILNFIKPYHKGENNSKITYTDYAGKEYERNMYNQMGGYNTQKNDRTSSRYKQHKFNDFQTYGQRYKWLKDILGNTLPYLGGKDSELFKYGVELSDYDYDRLYETDKYCQQIILRNRAKYKQLAVEIRAIKKINNEFTKLTKNILDELQRLNTLNITLSNNIKKYKDDKEKFTKLVMLFGSFSKFYNTILSFVASYQKDLKQLNNIMQDKNRSSDPYTIKRLTENVQNQYISLMKYMESENNIADKINNIINN